MYLIQRGDLVNVELLLPGGRGRHHALQPLVVHALPVQLRLARLALRQFAIALADVLLLLEGVVDGGGTLSQHVV